MPCQARRQRTCTIWQAATILQDSLSTSNQASWPKNTQISPLKQLILRWRTTLLPPKNILLTTTFINKFTFADFLSQIYKIFPPMENFALYSFLHWILLCNIIFFVQKITWFFFVLKNYNFCIFRSNNNKN